MSIVPTLPDNFPSDFLWGASTSAFQSEGALDVRGKGRSVADIRSADSPFMDTRITSDAYHHVEDDVALMKELGLRTYRFSIAWTRIFPNGNDEQPNQDGLAFYHRLIDALVTADITPVVTIFHFDYPQALVDQYGGWANRQSVRDYVRYAKLLFTEFGKQVHHWLTINEHSLLANVPAMNGLKDATATQREQANYNMFLAQALAIAACREMDADALIGPAVSYMTNLPYDHTSTDVLLSKQLEDDVAFITMDVAVRGELPTYYARRLARDGIELATEPEDAVAFKNGRANFLGLNWYATSIFRRAAGKDPRMLKGVMSNVERWDDPRVPQSRWHFNCDAVGLRYALQRVHDRYPHLPLMITECGWADEDVLDGERVHDERRVTYLNDHIFQLREAVRDGVNIIGFCPWSFIDLLSVGDGMTKRYGLVYVDQDNDAKGSCRRIPKDSYRFYQQVIATNSRNVTAMRVTPV